jgi:hypothetical protein
MPATDSIRALNSEESEDTRGDYFTGRQGLSDRQQGALYIDRSGASSGSCQQWILPAAEWHHSWTRLAAWAPVAAPLLARRPELLSTDRCSAAATGLPRSLVDVATPTGSQITGS